MNIFLGCLLLMIALLMIGQLMLMNRIIAFSGIGNSFFIARNDNGVTKGIQLESIQKIKKMYVFCIFKTKEVSECYQEALEDEKFLRG